MKRPSLRLRGRVGGWLAAGWLGVMVLAAITAPWLPFERSQNLRNIRAAPSWRHPFGTDGRGIDMVGRIIDGARISLSVGIFASLIGLVIGATIGIIAGYRRGRIDRLIVVGLDVFAAFPSFVAASLAALVWGRSLRNVILVLGVLTAPVFARVTRAATLPLAERDFVVASRMIGARHRRVMTTELVPNIAIPVLSYGLLAAGVIIGIEGALSFFGAGVPDEYTTWGKLIASGQERVNTSPHLSLIPAAVIVLTVLALNTLADRWQRRWLFGSSALPRVAPAPKATPARVAEDTAIVDPIVPGGREGLTIENLHTHLITPFGIIHAVDGVDLRLEPGTITALVGESGSGKTMVARSVIGLVNSPIKTDVPGRILFRDHDLRQLGPAAMRSIRGRRVAMVFQDPMTSLDPVQRIGRQLMEPMHVHLGTSRSEARTRAIELLRAVGIPDPERRMRAFPHQLSGGLRQRVAIAIALSCDPDVLIADEPTSALDVTVQAQLLDLLGKLCAERRLAVLLITHDLGVVAGYAREVAVMYAGKIVEQGQTRPMFAAPRHPYTRALLDAVPRLSHDPHHRLTSIPGTPPILLGRPRGCAFAPRCTAATDQCRSDDPVLTSIEEGRLVACWHPVGLTPPVHAQA
jgi:peptide/nickel transport system permease protein